MPDKEDLHHLLERTADSVNAARAHYQIWFTLRGKGKALPEYYDVMNDSRYVSFFHASNAGHYKLMFIELGCLFDPDTRAASFRNLKKGLEQEGRSDLVTKIDADLSPYTALVSSILTIRSKLMAHKEIGAESRKVHEQNGIIPDEIGRLLDISSELINYIDEQVFGNKTNLKAAVTSTFEDATFGLLGVLRNGRS